MPFDIKTFVFVLCLVCGCARGATLHSPVSITRYKSDSFLVADYRNLFLVDIAGNRHTIIPQLFKSKWNPASVQVHGGLIYIANYSGSNVIVGTISAGRRFQQTGEITSVALKSPEGVAVDDDYVVVADYDGSSITAFGHDGLVRWKTGLSLAHGVWTHRDYVYATALREGDRLVKLRKSDGQKVAGVRERGWVSGYIYPTSIVEARGSGLPGDLLIVDADVGAIISIDLDLKEIARFGKNSPQLWQRPYAAVARNGSLYVTDTEGGQLKRLTDDKVRTFGPDSKLKHFGKIEPRGSKIDLFCGEYAAKAPFSAGLRVTLGYQTACLFNDREGWNSKAIWPVRGPLMKRPPNGFGYTWQFDLNVKNQVFTVTGSAGRRVLMAALGNEYIFISLPDDWVIWGRTDDPVVLDYIRKSILKEWRNYKKIQAECGDLAAFIFYGAPDAWSPPGIQNFLTGETAKALVMRWAKGYSISEVDIRNITDKGRTFYIDDLAIISRLVGIDSNFAEGKLENCQLADEK